MWLFLLILGLFFMFGAMYIIKPILGGMVGSPRYGYNATPEDIEKAKATSEAELNRYTNFARIGSYSLAGLFLVLGLLSTSFHRTPTKMTSHLIKKYATSHLADDRVIAINGEMGRQARLLQEGLNFQFFLNVLYDIEDVPNIIIPPGQVGLLKAIDGKVLPQSTFIAPDWVSFDNEGKRAEIESKMLDAKYFIENGGHAGPQLNVLTPNEYKINQYLWSVKTVPATTIAPGFVGVVFSQVGDVPEDIEMSTEGGNLAQPLVPKGFKGVWREPLTSGMYYLNTMAYQITDYDTRIQTWVYAGGYTKKTIDLKYDTKGEIVQEESSEKIPIPAGAAGPAIDVKSKDAWIIYNEARVQIQVEPLNAPRIFASVGTLRELEDRVITPILRSGFRNQGEGELALNFLNARSKIEAATEKTLRLEGQKAGVSIKGFKLAEVVIPPELLVPAKRTQLANQMKATYKEEEKAYKQRKKSENARALADQQGDLVKADIAEQAAEKYRLARAKEGMGERDYMKFIAEGQRAQVAVLGLENAQEIQLTKMILDAAENRPEMFNTPHIYVNVSGGGNGNGLGEVEKASFALLALDNVKNAVNKAKDVQTPNSNAQPAPRRAQNR